MKPINSLFQIKEFKSKKKCHFLKTKFGWCVEVLRPFTPKTGDQFIIKIGK